MKDRQTAADVEKPLQHWTGSVIDLQLKPLQAKAKQLGETAHSLASSLESRCREFIRNTKYDMSGLGDSRRLRAAMALNRVSGEIVTASGEFLKSNPNESISKLETSITRLLRAAGSSYNESVRAMASHYASEIGWESAEIEARKRRNVKTGRTIHKGSVAASERRGAYPSTGNRRIDAICENPADGIGQGIRRLS